jgi:hypothetical protein
LAGSEPLAARSRIASLMRFISSPRFIQRRNCFLKRFEILTVYAIIYNPISLKNSSTEL